MNTIVTGGGEVLEWAPVVGLREGTVGYFEKLYVRMS